MELTHTSVLLEECIEGLQIQKNGIYVDCTLGGAGHSKEIGQKLDSNGTLVGIDQDDYALNKASLRLENVPCKKILIRDNFQNIKEILKTLDIEKVDGILMDLGVSSFQLDNGDRGFSYNQDAPLDMRMDKRAPFSAYELVNEYQDKDLFRIIKSYGEEKFASRITREIIKSRDISKIETTGQLVDIIKKAIPAKARREGPHPAKRTFQAIRIEVNRELEILKDAIRDSVSVLNSNGRICIITFHSLEDRIVKQTFKELTNPCTCPPDFPQCICKNEPTVEIITRKPIYPSEEELIHNPRSRSAKLRIAKKI